ncbi:MAG: hypothetical protein IKJ83_00225 [Ruminococcus sp.]|nr:hypothetical protein [Ruminococcus sp.]
MIDIHSHILPGIDDGARDVYDTLEMALMAVNSGVKAIIATPHCNIPWSNGNYLGSEYREALQKARNAIAQERMPIKIFSGMEVFVTFDLPELITEGKILTLNHSDYLLIEFDFEEDPEFVDIMVSRLKELGIKPVIAHPERYDFIKEDIMFAKRLVKAGCILQANKGSFLGHYGARSEKTALDMVKAGLVQVVASDAHSPVARTPYMLDARRAIKEFTDTKTLFETNPERICLNRPLETLQVFKTTPTK